MSSTNLGATVRFAPSPTGYIHIGNARTALFNWLIAKPSGGRFVLRLDDTDEARSTVAFADAIIEDLAWLGIVPDAVERQSARRDRHDAAADRLRAAGRLYPCYETPDELDRQRARQRLRGRPPIYDRTGLRQSAEERAALEAEGRRPHWRFLLPNTPAGGSEPERTEVSWDDLVRGPQTVDLGSLSDPVLIRDDGSHLYTLPSVVDDLDFGITDVVRGDDHVTNTGVQITLFKALGAPVPRFGHHNLLISEEGSGLSKRDGALSLRALREDGIEPETVATLAARTGMAGEVGPARGLDALAEGFDPADASRSAARFSVGELEALNAEVVHAMSYERAAPVLVRAIGERHGGEAFWLAVRANCERVRDASGWWKAIREPDRSAMTDEQREAAREAIDLLPEGPVDDGTWKRWTDLVKRETGRKGRALFMPIRLALTGLDHGPELGALLPLIGREGIVARRP